MVNGIQSCKRDWRVSGVTSHSGQRGKNENESSMYHPHEAYLGVIEICDNSQFARARLCRCPQYYLQRVRQEDAAMNHDTQHAKHNHKISFRITTGKGCLLPILPRRNSGYAFEYFAEVALVRKAHCRCD